MKKNDWIMICSILLIGGLFLVFQLIKPDSGESIVRVSKNGETFGTYQLNKDQIISVDSCNTFKIEKRTVKMLEADCPDQICVHHSSISKNGESIICLPNRVIVSIEKDDDPAIDAVVQ